MLITNSPDMTNDKPVLVYGIAYNAKIIKLPMHYHSIYKTHCKVMIIYLFDGTEASGGPLQYKDVVLPV